MRILSFSAPGDIVGGRLIRNARFEERSTLSVSAACLVANSMRDVLATALMSPVELRLFEASIPSLRGWQAITRGAVVFTSPGVALILRMKDAQAFARAAFGEVGGQERALSAMESAALDRIVASIGSAFAPVLNGAQPRLQRATDAGNHATYFEIQVENPACFRIGIALEADPADHPRTTLGLEALLDVQLEVAVRSAPTTMLAAQVASLEPGAIVPMTKSKGAAFALVLAGRPLASGECGVTGDRFAYAISRLHDAEGSYGPSL